MGIFDFLKGDNKTAEEYFALATEKIQKGLYNEAIPSYNKAIEKDLNYSDAYHDRGLAKDYVRDYFGAIKDFEKAIELDPTDAMAYYNRARSKYSKSMSNPSSGNFSDVIQDNLMALKLLDKDKDIPAYVPENIKQLIFLNNGLARNSLKDFETAISDFTEAIKLDENFADGYQNRAVSNMCLENFNDALKDAEKALELGNSAAQQIIDNALEQGAVNYTEGLNESFHENGKIKERFHVKNGKKEGLQQNYYENGQLMSEHPYKNGILCGVVSLWYEDGNKLNISEFKSDEICHGLCQHWWPNGQLAMRGRKINGRQHGLWENYYQNGQLQSKGNWNHGFNVFDGVGGIWYENGNIDQETVLIDGKIICKQYDIKGKLEKEIDFTSGEYLAAIMHEPNEQSIKELIQIILWSEREELGDEIESILDDIGYVSPLPKSDDIIKMLESSGTAENLELVDAIKSAVEFNKNQNTLTKD